MIALMIAPKTIGGLHLRAVSHAAAPKRMAAEDATATPFAPMRFRVHSALHDNGGWQIVPSGLEWDLPGRLIVSHVASDQKFACNVNGVAVG